MHGIKKKNLKNYLEQLFEFAFCITYIYLSLIVIVIFRIIMINRINRINFGVFVDESFRDKIDGFITHNQLFLTHMKLFHNTK